jgi:hypothetical protein
MRMGLSPNPATETAVSHKIDHWKRWTPTAPAKFPKRLGTWTGEHARMIGSQALGFVAVWSLRPALEHLNG